MSTTELTYLFRSEPPWIYVGLGEPDRKHWNPSHFYTKPSDAVCVRRLRASKMRTTQALMNEIGAALQFFDAFGENWPALKECLFYLDEWLPADAYVLIVDDVGQLLAEEDVDQLAAFLQTMHQVGEWWSKPITDNGRFNRSAVPFHTLLHVREGESGRAENIAQLAQSIEIPVRV